MNVNEEALKLHKMHKGKLTINSKTPIKKKEDLSLTYTPGVAAPCLEIKKDKDKVYDYTIKGNTVAVVTNGTAVLGLGDIGPEAALPVMEGKSLLFKEFGGIDAFPICLNTKDKDEIVDIIKAIAPTFGGINLEDIKAPECFYIEERLKKELNIPVFHDDQHGTAVVVLAALINALKIVNKRLEHIKIVINGAGAAGIAIGKLLLFAGAKNIVICDRKGAICEGDESLNSAKKDISKVTNRALEKGSLKDVIKNKDIFIGVSAPEVLNEEMVSSMNKDSIIFAMSNPIPEIMPDKALKAGARIVATGRSDFPNQVNNLLVFPGIFKGALEIRAKAITEEMKLAAAIGIASLVKEEELKEEYIIPDPLDKRVAEAVASEVKRIGRR